MNEIILIINGVRYDTVEIEGYGNYYCPKCSGMKVEEGQDVYN